MGSQNFDEQTAGQAPTGWINQSSTVFQVTNAQFNSIPNSYEIFRTPGTGRTRRPTEIGSGLFEWYLFITGISQFIEFGIADNNANFAVGDMIVYIQVDGASNIKYWNGVAFIDTGFNVVLSQWKQFAFNVNFAAGTYDIQYDTINIASGLSTLKAALKGQSFHKIARQANPFTDDYSWIDFAPTLDQPGYGVI